MSRRTATLVTSAVLTVGLGVGGAFMPVPYVTLSPGPTYNTLGSVDGHELITVKGHPSYPVSGHLDLVTVSVGGGPPGPINLGTALADWLDPNVEIVPQEEIYPPNQKPSSVEQANRLDMQSSQISAEAAALTELGYRPSGFEVAAVEQGFPAAGVLKPGDTFVSIDGTPVTSLDDVAKLIGKHAPGDSVPMVIKRGGKQVSVSVGTKAAADDPKHAVIGVLVGPRWPVQVLIDPQFAQQVGGPSAGMMFALGIIDKLTPGQLTGGHYIAGTGEITPDGKVGPIGGIAQKMVGAHNNGATVFLAPAGNCQDVAKASVPSGLRVVKVATLHDALTAVKSVASNDAAALPSCS